MQTAMQGLLSRQEEERKVNAQHRDQSREDRSRMKFEMKELANMKDEVTEGVCDKVADKLDTHMRAFAAATEEMRARVRSAERDTVPRQGIRRRARRVATTG